jgi:hypothetical protein
VILHFV